MSFRLFKYLSNAQDFAMSDLSPILVLQIKICIKPDRHAVKVAIKSEKLSPFGGFFSIMKLQTISCLILLCKAKGGSGKILDIVCPDTLAVI